MQLVEHLAVVNAVLNLTSAALLSAGFLAIRRREVARHRALMLSAVASSALFLVTYLTRVALSGTHRFPDVGAWRLLYLTVLASHTLLATLVVPLVLATLYLGLSRRFPTHRRLARLTWPTWMYVSVTGIVVYVLLYQVAPRLAAGLAPPP